MPHCCAQDKGRLFAFNAYTSLRLSMTVHLNPFRASEVSNIRLLNVPRFTFKCSCIEVELKERTYVCLTIWSISFGSSMIKSYSETGQICLQVIKKKQSWKYGVKCIATSSAEPIIWLLSHIDAWHLRQKVQTCKIFMIG